MKNLKQLLILIAFVFVVQPFNVDARSADENIFYYFQNSNGLESFMDNYRHIDILAPQMYEVGFTNKLIMLDGFQEVLEFADDKRVDVMPLVVNAAFNREHMSQFLRDDEAQKEVIDDLIRDAKKYDYVGYQYDFENIHHVDRQLYVDFVQKTYKEFKRARLLFSVAVIPRTSDYDPESFDQDWSSGYDIENIAKYADFISVMSYDDPRSKGPVASMEYLKKALNHTQKYVEDKKISMGIPLYCWQYEVGNPKKIASVTYSISAATQEKYQQYGALSTYVDGDYETEVFLFIKPVENKYVLNIIWCDNEQSIEAKQKLAKKEKLRGLSFWALGQEDDNIWKHL